jgi:hypothetical protein
MKRIAVAAFLILSLVGSTPAAPSLDYLDSGQWGFNDDCAVQGDNVATMMAYGVQLWNAADPAAPIFLGDHYIDGYRGRAIDWEGDLVAATDNLGHIYLLDVSDPTQPTQIQRLSGAGADPDVLLRRDGGTRWCYTAGNASNDFQIRDLTDPAADISHGALNLSGTPNGMALLAGDVVLVSARSFGLYAIDVSDPDSPQVLDSLDLPGTHFDVSADGTRAALASTGTGFTLIDVGDPANLVVHATVSPAAGEWSGLSVREVIVSGSTLYAVCENAGVLSYDISNLDSPVLNGYDPALDLSPPSPPYYIFNEGVLFGDKLYLSHWSGLVPGCVILDASTGDMDYLGRTPGYDYIRDVDEEDGFVYACTGHFGIVAHEHVSEFDFQLRGQLQVPATWGVAARGDLAYIASADEGLVIGDFSDPMNPVQRGDLHVGQGRQLEVIGDVAYIAAFTQGFHTVDVSNPDAPVSLDSETRSGMEAINVSVVGDLAVTSDRGDGMNIWSVSDPSDIQHLANYPTAAHALDVTMTGDQNYVYLTVANVGVEVIDISTPGSPSLVHTFAFGSTGTTLENGYLHVTTGGAGLTSYHQSVSPTAPIELAAFNTTHTAYASAAVQRDATTHYIYVADYSGLTALRLSADTAVAVSSFDLSWDGSSVDLSWQLGEAMSAENLRLVVFPEGSDLETELAFMPADAEGLAWSAVDTRPELTNGGLWRYELQGREPGGDWMLLRSEELNIETAPGPVLSLRAHPNPFNPSTRLSFDLPTEGKVSLAIYDLAGRHLALIHEGSLPAGPAAFEWEGRDDQGRPLASGVYFARLGHSGGNLRTKLVMIR